MLLYFRFLFILFFLQLIDASDVTAQDATLPPIIGSGKGLFTVGELLACDPLDDPESFEKNWQVQMQSNKEIEGYAEIRNNKLETLSPGGCTIWYKRKFSDPICICYKVVVSDDKDTANIINPRDINNFWMAGEIGDMNNILNNDQYKGKFSHYHGMQGYYASMGGGSLRNNNRTVRMRRYPRKMNNTATEHLALKYQDNNPVLKIIPNKEYRIQLVAFHDLIQFIVNEQLVYEIQYGMPVSCTKNNKDFYGCFYSPEKFPVYQEGYFGFRMVHTFHKYYDFEVYRLVAEH